MKYLMTFFWAFVLLQMVNFVLNSLNGEGNSLNVVSPIIMAVIFTMTTAILGAIISPKNKSEQYE
ncbi:YjzD family protein [Staphylococcus pasteuri]|uniref:YjzD family protein n=1 Tax=Staphylococcus pasteuri TaxID=45972 RepID=UPI002DBA84AA|nr:YjzD family protein [Staphylococcus pasteuri]MEB7434112.1 YjzD family protein [Staphylococcus pasteuri]